jgi:predicted HTH transcriptional regulator
MKHLIPERIQDWTLDKIQDLIDKNMTESERHDFKSNIPDSVTLSRICCAFANSRGGFILFGVAEKNGKFVIEGFSPDIEISKKFGDKLKASPRIYFNTPINVPTSDSATVITIFEIPISPERPHSTMTNNIPTFYKRTNRENEIMSYEEIRNEFSGYERQILPTSRYERNNEDSGCKQLHHEKQTGTDIKRIYDLQNKATYRIP